MDTQQITTERLEGWKKRLAIQTATPLMLIGIGQEAHAGVVVLCAPENGPSNSELAQMLRGVAKMLEG